MIVFHAIIPHEFDLEAIVYLFIKYEEELDPRFKTELILESANILIKDQTLTFDPKFYWQIKRTAIGIIFAPTYVNLTMGYHEIRFYSIMYQLRSSRQTFSKFLVEIFRGLSSITDC